MLSSSVLGSLIDANLAGVGATGYNRTIFSNAVAKGIVESIVGKSFQTQDEGQTPGSGTGAGVGIMALSASSMQSTAIAAMPTTGYNAQKLMQAIMEAVVTHLSSAATLTSTDSPVYSGTGMIVVGTIAVIESEMKNNITK